MPATTTDRSETVRRSLECGAVVKAASALGLREFDFFRLAYRRWFGRQPDERVLESAFASYMFREVVPVWARQLARQVLERQRCGTLGRDDFGASRYRERPARPPHGRLWIAATAAAWLVFMVMLVNRPHDVASGYGPASLCSDGGRPHPLAVMVEIVTGKPPPVCTQMTPQR